MSRSGTKTIGVFLDTFGKDTYIIDKEIKGRMPLAKDNSTWKHSNGPIFYGLGIDMDLYKN